jgi:alpha-mannosidase
MSIRCISLCHHSHTDIGYTHDQPTVTNLHRRFIDNALDCADAGADRGPATFRWTCEVTWALEHWLKRASTRDIDRLVRLTNEGQIEACAMWCNLTPLPSLERLDAMCKPIERLRKYYGIPVSVAMNSDVNGFSWPLTDILLDIGVSAMSMSINEHFGNAPEPRPGLIRWQTPTQREMLVWNGFTYAHSSWLEIGGDHDKARSHIRDLVEQLDKRGYPYDTLYMQYTHPGPQNDNMGPVPWLSDWVQAFDPGDGPRIEIVTPSMYFEQVRQDVDLASVPQLSGEWRDWWNFGCASTPRPTSENRRAQIRLRDADALTSLVGDMGFSPERAATAEAIDLYNEHTWGADCAVHHPYDPDTYTQALFADEPAYRARSGSRFFYREAMDALAKQISTTARPSVLIYNPTPVRSVNSVKVARRLLNAQDVPNPPGSPTCWPDDLAYRHFADRNLWSRTDTIELGPFDLPAYGWTIATIDDKRADAPATIDGLTIDAGGIVVRFAKDEPGVESITAGGREWLAPNPLGAMRVISERIEAKYSDIFEFDDSQMPAWTRIPQWKSGVMVTRSLPTLTDRAFKSYPGGAACTETYQLDTCRKVTQVTQVDCLNKKISIDIEIDKSSVTTPHSLYFVMPFGFTEPRIAYEGAGCAVGLDEVIEGSSPWVSHQYAFAMGDTSDSVYVGTPDAALVQFGRFPIGNSAINHTDAASPGLALSWLYNNYWETNFRNGESGAFRYSYTIELDQEPLSATKLMTTGAASWRTFDAHPMTSPVASASLPTQGALIGFQSTDAILHAIAPTPDGLGDVVATVVNPTTKPQQAVLSSGALQISTAHYAGVFGELSDRIDVDAGAVRIQLPPRGIARVYLGMTQTTDGVPTLRTKLQAMHSNRRDT